MSYNDEAWLTLDELDRDVLVGRGHVAVLGFDSKRYVGAQIGIHNPKGERVGVCRTFETPSCSRSAGPAISSKRWSTVWSRNHPPK